MKKSALVFLSSIFYLLVSVFCLPSSVFSQSDTTPPLTTATLSGTQGQNGWYTSGVNVDLVADDLESGVHSINWKLDDGDWQQEEFLGTLNRVQNPSFEGGGLFWIDKWDHPWVPFWQSIFLRSWYHKFGSRSARIVFLGFFGSNYYYWHNSDYYSPTTAGKVYTATAWVKTDDISGDGGASMAIWARSLDGSDTQIAETTRISGDNDWMRITHTFVMLAGYDGVFLRLGAESNWGSVWFDGVSFYEEEETGVSFAVGESGEHTLEYYAVDSAGNEETPHKTLDFKIDTSAPSGWKNFEAAQTINEHTFQCSIDVSDSTSGVGVSTAAYQYTYNGGATWSSWLTDVIVTPDVDGSETVRLTTGDVDFHDSDWSVGKIIRFRISDLAGLEGVSPDQDLLGAWTQTTGGDVYSGEDISFAALGSEANAEGVVVASGTTVDGFTSIQDWEVKPYPPISRRSYEGWQEKFPTTTPLPYGRLPLESGRYFAGDEDFVVDAQTIPAEPGSDLASTENLAAVIFVGGDLVINDDLEVHPTSVLLFIVGGGVRISQDVIRADASFLFGDGFDTSYDGAPPQEQLVINGSVVGDEFIFRRSLSGDGNLNQPAEIFNYPAKIIDLAPYIGEEAVRWRER